MKIKLAYKNSRAGAIIFSLCIMAASLISSCKKDVISEEGANDAIAKIQSQAIPGSISGTPGQVYFTQNFNSSTNYLNYVGNTANLFTHIPTVGTVTVNTTNNKFQIVKKAGSGTNRGSFGRSSAFPIGPNVGFMKWSMEVTLTENDEYVSNGFQFAVGELNATLVSAPAAPAKTNIHSWLFVAPTVVAGEFKLLGEVKESAQAFAGTQTVIWYVNNTGAPVGYTAPDGTIQSIQIGCNDVWVKNSAGVAVLAIDEDPAINTNKKINSFKFSNNPSFNSTLDIDNLVISEEPIVVIPKIVSVQSIAPFTVPYRTSIDLANITKQTEVTYDTGDKEMVQVVWSSGAVKYNGYQVGTYPIKGTIIPNAGTANPDNLGLENTITVKVDITIPNAFTPNNDGKNDTWMVKDLKNYRSSSIEVYDRDGSLLFQTTNPDQGWDGKNKNGQVIAGSYNYVVKVPDLSLERKGSLTVIK